LTSNIIKRKTTYIKIDRAQNNTRERGVRTGTSAGDRLTGEQRRPGVRAELANAYEVATDTVRRDLAVLDRAGFLRRVHGGAVPARALRVVEPDLMEREGTRAEYKDAIARAALEFLPDNGGSVLLDADSTGRLAAALSTDRDLVVATNALPIAARLCLVGSICLQLHGGLVRDLTQAAVKQAMVNSARYVVVLADSSKFGREDLMSFAPIDRVDVLITDPELRPVAGDKLSQRGIEVVIA
jgi:DeoR family fructose operon transcriptional repressor